MKAKSIRIFFAAGPGNVIEAHKRWLEGHYDATLMSVPFSSEFASACRELGASAHVVSSASPVKFYKDKQFIVEHRPKRVATGVWYHVVETLYGVGLLRTAIKFKSDYAVIQSGSTHYFVLALFRMAGIKVIPVMYNTLWPAGFPPRRLIPRVILFLDSLLFKWFASATLCLSPECERQVESVTYGKHCELVPFVAQYVAHHFQPQEPPPSIQQFRLLFAGRIVRNKGIFDLLQVMKLLNNWAPGQTMLIMCGGGPDLEKLRIESCKMGLDEVVSIRGWTSPIELRKMLIESHVLIVPTRSDFAEGLALVAVEAILTGRPVITSPVVPALEVLRPACVAAETDDVHSYANALIDLIENPRVYEKLLGECGPLQGMFYDRSKSFEAMLKRVIRSKAG
jgi:glycogen synthase